MPTIANRVAAQLAGRATERRESFRALVFRVVDTGGRFRDELQEQKHGREIYHIFLILALAALVTEAMLGRHA